MKQQTLFGRPVVEVDDMPYGEIVLGHYTDRVKLKIEMVPSITPGAPVTFRATACELEEDR